MRQYLKHSTGVCICATRDSYFNFDRYNFEYPNTDKL